MGTLNEQGTRVIRRTDIRIVVAREFPMCSTDVERDALAERLGINRAQLWNLAARVRAVGSTAA